MSAGIGGVDAYPVRVEADVSEGLPQFLMVGYLASEVKEAGDRVRTALKNAGCPLPPKRITVNLAPASVRKAGSRFDLAVAAAVLASMQKIPAESLDGLMIAGELSLSGQVLGIPGVLALTEAAREAGIRRCIVPKVNAREGALVREAEVVGVSDLAELMELLRHPEKGTRTEVDADGLLRKGLEAAQEDFSQIRGQKALRRAAEIAAAGMHNFLMIGPPGSGKTMIARRIPGILPGLTLEESLRITKGRETAAAGGDFPEHRRHSLPGRASGISPLRSGDPAPAPGGAPGLHLQDGGHLPVPGGFYAGGGHESLRLRLLSGQEPLQLRAPGDFPVSGAFKPASSGPHRYLYAGAEAFL